MTAAKMPEKLNPLAIIPKELTYVNSDELYFQAIENANGVPFHLIFGEQPGEGHYYNIGDGIESLLGISPADFTEKRFHEMIIEIVPISDLTPASLYESRQQLIKGEIKGYKAEVLVRLPNGDKKWIFDSSLPLADNETGNIIGVFGILFDINERKKILENLLSAEERASESERLKIAFLRNISHEIRTPLNAIVGFSSILNQSKDSLEINKEFLEIISRSSGHLLDIINNIVEISNIEANTLKLKPETFNLNEELLKLFKEYNNIASEKGICLYFNNIPDSKLLLCTDKYKLRQILSNLLSNAIKFTHEGKVSIGCKLIENNIEFSICDTGIGIDSQYHEMIFDRFVQVENGSTRRFDGTGLGLSISKAYADLLGGKIWFNSEPGKGTDFYFSIPYFE